MSNWKKPSPPPEGRVRASQMIGTYGPGAMIDLLNHAVLVGGLDSWKFSVATPPIREDRLRDRLRQRRANDGSVTLHYDAPFRAPPIGND